MATPSKYENTKAGVKQTYNPYAYGGAPNISQAEAELQDPAYRTARSSPSTYGAQIAAGMAPQFESYGRLVMPEFQREIGAQLGGTFAKTGRSGALTVSADRVSQNFADRMAEYRNMLLGQAMGLGVQHSGNLMGDYRAGQQNVLGMRQFEMGRQAYQTELEMAKQAAKQKRKNSLLRGVGTVLGGAGGFLLGGPAGAYAGAQIGGAAGGAI